MFQQFLQENYNEAGCSKVNFLLDRFGIKEEIESIIADFYETIARQDKYETIAQFVFFITGFLSATNSKLVAIQDLKERKAAEKQIIELGIFLIRDTYSKSNLNQNEYFDILKQTLKKTYKQKKWDFSGFDSLLNLENLKAYSVKIKSPASPKTSNSKPHGLNWCSKYPLEFFVDDLFKALKGIKTKTNFFKLFDASKERVPIELPEQYLSPLLLMFYQLHKTGVLKVKGNRGLYKLIENYFVPPAGQSFPKRDFRKLRYDLQNNPAALEEANLIIQPIIQKVLDFQ